MIIYKITNKINGLVYIGQTTTTLQSRWYQHCRTKSSCTFISRAIQKYGKKAFKIKILCQCNTIEEMNYREEYYIRLFNTLAPNGYNLTPGGKNRRLSKQTKYKLSKLRTGKNNPMYGTPCPNKGKKLNKETRKYE